MPPSHARPEAHPDASDRLSGLDGLRGIAILLVIVWHYFIDQRATGPDADLLVVRLLRWTWSGVDLFFVLSGFLIARNLLGQPADRKTIAIFFVRRAGRLLPLYVLFLLAYLLARPFLLGWNAPVSIWLAGETIGPSWSYPLFMQNIAMAINGSWPGHWLAPTWTLAVEVQFYLVAPLLFLVIPRRHLVPALLGIAAFSIALRCAFVAFSDYTLAAHVLFPCRAETFCIGASIAVLMLDPDREDWFRRNIHEIERRFKLLVAALLIMSAAGVVLHSVPMSTLGYTFLAVTASHLLLIALYVDTGRWRSILSNKMLRHIGVRSFGYYLIHQPVRGMLALVLADYSHVEPMSPVLSLAAFALTALIAATSWRWVEAPAIAWSRRYAAGSKHAPTAATHSA